MKKLLFGLGIAVLAIGGSAFKNANRAINENYMLQTSPGTFIRQATAPGTCTSNMGMNCEYAVTAFGRVYIPAQSSYTSSEIQDYLNNEYLEDIPNVGPGTYHAP